MLIALFSVFDYIYVLFYNSIWTVLSCPAIGLFDRIARESPSSSLLSCHTDKQQTIVT